MTGRPLKAPEVRVSRVKPQLGEWVDLEPLEVPVLPEYPAAWSRRGSGAIPRWLWDYWRRDPVTGQWSEADVGQALELGAHWSEFKPEHRLRMQTYIGLNAKGRRDLRWRTPVESKSAEKADAAAAEARRMRIREMKRVA